MHYFFQLSAFLKVILSECLQNTVARVSDRKGEWAAPPAHALIHPWLRNAGVTVPTFSFPPWVTISSRVLYCPPAAQASAECSRDHHPHKWVLLRIQGRIRVRTTREIQAVLFPSAFPMLFLVSNWFLIQCGAWSQHSMYEPKNFCQHFLAKRLQLYFGFLFFASGSHTFQSTHMNKQLSAFRSLCLECVLFAEMDKFRVRNVNVELWTSVTSAYDSLEICLWCFSSPWFCECKMCVSKPSLDLVNLLGSLIFIKPFFIERVFSSHIDPSALFPPVYLTLKTYLPFMYFTVVDGLDKHLLNWCQRSL